MKILRNKKLFFALLVGLNFWLWFAILAGDPAEEAKFYFWDVGQGDSELVVLPSGQKILIDAGPDGSHLGRLSKALKSGSRLDLIIISHPHSDHYGGLASILNSFRIGAVFLGEESLNDPLIKEVLEDSGTAWAILGSGDKIFLSGAKAEVFQEKALPDLNERSLVIMIETEGVQALFTGDIGAQTEKSLADFAKSVDFQADILKVGHHGSAGSSSEEFLRALAPKIGVIEVGENNVYKLPASAALERIKRYTPNIFRTDENGDILIKAQKGRVAILSQR